MCRVARPTLRRSRGRPSGRFHWPPGISPLHRGVPRACGWAQSGGMGHHQRLRAQRPPCKRRGDGTLGCRSKRDARNLSVTSHRPAAQAGRAAVPAQHRPGRALAAVMPSIWPRMARRSTLISRRWSPRWRRAHPRGGRAAPGDGWAGRRQALWRPRQLLRLHRRADPHLGHGRPPVAGCRCRDGLTALGRALRPHGGADRRSRRIDRTSQHGPGRTKREAEQELQAKGVPATALSSPAELLDSPQLAHRGAFEPLRSPAVVGHSRWSPVSRGERRQNRGHESRRRRSLRGLRILEASRVLAVPLAGSILGALGAEVHKLEDRPRLDMYRRRGPYVDGETGSERGAYFALVNHSKQSEAFDVDSDRRRLEKLLSAADVVLENLGPKRASALGLARPWRRPTTQDLLAISSSGFGQDGPHAKYRAYAYNLQASCAPWPPDPQRSRASAPRSTSRGLT